MTNMDVRPFLAEIIVYTMATIIHGYTYTLGVKDYKKEWSLGDLKGNFLYFSRSKYSLWTSRVAYDSMIKHDETTTQQRILY